MLAFHDEDEKKDLARKIKPHTGTYYFNKIDTQYSRGFVFELWEHSHPSYPEDAVYILVTPNVCNGQNRYFEIDWFWSTTILRMFRKHDDSYGVAIARFRTFINDMMGNLGNGYDNLNDCLKAALEHPSVDIGYPYKEWKYSIENSWHVLSEYKTNLMFFDEKNYNDYAKQLVTT